MFLFPGFSEEQKQARNQLNRSICDHISNLAKRIYGGFRDGTSEIIFTIGVSVNHQGKMETDGVSKS